MRKFDVNGNTVSSSRAYCMRLIAAMTHGTYRTDAYGRIMVDTGDGGFIIFFEKDEPRVAVKVKGKLQHVDAWKDSPAPARHGPES